MFSLEGKCGWCQVRRTAFYKQSLSQLFPSSLLFCSAFFSFVSIPSYKMKSSANSDGGSMDQTLRRKQSPVFDMDSPKDTRLLHLPTEILIEIVKFLPNFSSLWPLWTLSPVLTFSFCLYFSKYSSTSYKNRHRHAPKLLYESHRLHESHHHGSLISWMLQKHMTSEKTLDLYFHSLVATP